MSCYACSKKYGFFCKEVGCPNCGFSFCTKCLKKTIQVPKCGNAERKVCLSCFEKITIQLEQQKLLSSKDEPLVLPKNMSVLDAPIPDEEKLPDIDEEIKKRLELTKQPLNDLEAVSDRGIAERLANLKGVTHKEYDNRKLINTVDQRTEQEKTNDLLEQFMGESSIDKAIEENDPIKDIERRLAILKGQSSTGAAAIEKKNSLDNSNELEIEDENVLAQKIVTKYLDEAKLPDSDLTPEEKEFVNSVKPSKDNEELPWCQICNEDAIIRCMGCDGDLYCRPCFKEIHDNDEEYREHKTKSFTPKSEQSQL